MRFDIVWNQFTKQVKGERVSGKRRFAFNVYDFLTPSYALQSRRI